MTKILTTEDAESLEAAFLGGLEEAQFAYERIVEHEAWKPLGFERFAEWWDERVTPSMRALSMRPTREIAAAVVEQVRKEEAELPPAQRRTQRELAEMVGVSQGSPVIRPRSTPERDLSGADLELAPDEEEPPLPVEFPKGQEHADASLAAIDEAVKRRVEAPERHSTIPVVDFAALDEAARRDSDRRAAVTNLRSVLTYLVSTSITAAELAARDYVLALDEFKQDDLDFAAETMAAIATLKRGSNG